MKKQNSAWNKLEQAIEYSSFSNKPPTKRCFSASGRDSQKHHRTRSLSNCHEIFIFSNRPKSGCSTIEKSQATLAVPNLTIKEFQSLFKAKCYDLQVSETADQESRFLLFCTSNLKNRAFKYSELGISTDSAGVIGKILANNQNFAYLDLAKNRLKDEGSLILLKNVKNSSCLAHLDLSSNEISEKGMQKCLVELVHNESIASLSLASHGQVRKNRLGTAGSKSLGMLLAENKTLSILNIASTGITPEGLDYILEGMKKNSTLLSLNIENNSISSKSTEKLAKALSGSEVTDLNLALNKIGNEGCEHIGKLLSYSYGQFCMLTKLNLSENRIGTSGLSKIFKALRNNSQLVELNLSKNNLSKGLSDEFLEFLYENNNLASLNLTGCSLVKDSLTGLAEGLSRNFGLKELIFANNFIQDTEDIATGLLKNKMLEVIDLSNNKLRDKALILLSKSVASHGVLHTLILKENCLQDESGRVLLELIRKNQQIVNVNLDFNSISVKYCREIKLILKKNLAEKKKQVVPALKKAINKIYADNSELEELHYKIMSLGKEKHQAEKTVKVEGFKLEHIKQLELQQLKELTEQYSKLKSLSQNLSVQIEETNNEQFVRSIKKHKISNERQITDSAIKIKAVEIEIRALEEKSEK